jgi:hypothetical protein
MSRPVIAERVNRFFGYTAVARVSSGKASFSSPAPRARAAPPSLRAIPADLGDSLREIADPELREVLESVARGLGAREGTGASR